MKPKFLASLFFLACLALLTVVSEILSTMKYSGEEIKGTNRTTTDPLHASEGYEGRGYEGKQGIFNSIKGQKGKGSYGGANIVHREPKKGAAMSSLATPSFFVSAALGYVVFNLVFLF